MASERIIQALIRIQLDPSSAGKVKQGLKGVEDGLEKVEEQAKEAGRKTKEGLERAEKAAKGLGSTLSSSAVAGAAAALTHKFIELASVAKQKLDEIKEKAVTLNSDLETTERVLGAAFGNPELGKEALKVLDEFAEKFVIDKDVARQFGQSLLPKSGDLDSGLELLRLMDIQMDSTGKSASELTFSLREAFGGDFRSFKDQFDVGNDVVNRIKELTPEIGQSAAIAKALGEEFQRLGKVNITDTLLTDTKAVKTEITDLQIILGKPIFEERKEAAQALSEVLKENATDFGLISGRVGDLIASVEEFISSGLTEFLKDIDPDQALATLDALFQLTETGKLLADSLLNLSSAGDTFNDTLQNAEGGIETVNTLLLELFNILKYVKAANDAFLSTLTPGLDAIRVLTGQISLDELGKRLENPLTAFSESLAASNKAYDEYLKRIEEDIERQKERKKALEDTSPANDKAIDDFLKEQAAADAAAEALKAYNDALAKVNEETEKLNKQFDRANLEARIDAERAKLDAIEDFSEKRLDLARKQAQRLEDIERQSAQRVSDAQKDLGREESDIARDHARERVDAEKEANKERVSIETEFRRRMRDIRQQFEISAEDALRAQDTIGFLQAQRQMEQATQAAQEERQTKVSEAQASAEEKRQALKVEQERELEDAQLANERKLEDLREQLGRELEENRIKQDRELEEQRLSEERKLADLAQANERRLADLKRADEQRRADLEQALAAELEIVRNYEAQKTQTQVQAAQERTRQLAQIERQNATLGDGERRTPGARPGREDRPTRHFGSIGHRAGGGYVGRGLYAMGEEGKEFVLNNATTKALEAMNGGRLTQAGVLGSVFSSQNVNFTQQNNFSERDDTRLLMAMLSRQMDQKLLQFTRKHK